MGRLAKNIGEDMEHPKMYYDKEFLDYADSKLSKFETLIAVERMSGNCLGIIGFSRTNNRITWFAVGRDYRNKGVGSRLLMTALRQLENTKEVTVTTFPDGYRLGSVIYYDLIISFVLSVSHIYNPWNSWLFILYLKL